MKTKLKILMTAAELTPIAKVGGLADVVGSLPQELEKLGLEIKIIIPLYGSIKKSKFGLKKIHSNIKIPSGRVMINTNIWEAKLGNTPIYFIDAPKYFKFDKIYLDSNNSERFLFFSFACLYVLPILNYEPDIIHCHDSHTAPIPSIIKSSNLEYINTLKTLYTIHNFYYQGKTNPLVLSTGNLNKDILKSLSIDAQDGDINFMVQGILNADLINTVSPTYAKEITTSAYGASLENIIVKRKTDLFGILNGIDLNFFNPKTDPYIYHQYDSNSLSKKAKNKTRLQKELGLKTDENIPIVSAVSRLVWQKGFDLFTEKFSEINCQYVFLGTGEKKLENFFLKMAKKYPKQIYVKTDFDAKLAQKIYAGSDIFAMPSRFEPCGLGQMIAMRYGTIPLARNTGGLSDTIKKLEYKKNNSGKYIINNKNQASGFLFEKIEESDFFNCLQDAVNIYHQNPKDWQKIKENCIKQDFSWKKSAKEYYKLYKKITKK